MLLLTVHLQLVFSSVSTLSLKETVESSLFQVLLYRECLTLITVKMMAYAVDKILQMVRKGNCFGVCPLNSNGSVNSPEYLLGEVLKGLRSSYKKG